MLNRCNENYQKKEKEDFSPEMEMQMLNRLTLIEMKKKD